VQLYIRDVKSTVIQPVKKLRDFSRIYLDKGETRTVTFTLDNDDFSYWDENKKRWHIEKGEFEILLASSSQNIRKTVKISAL
jgi:beta-glucosidase